MRKILLIILLLPCFARAQTYFAPGIPPSSTSFTPTFRYNGTDSLASYYLNNSNRWSQFYTSAQANARFVATNIYKANGTLTGSRTLTTGVHPLEFIGGTGVITTPYTLMNLQDSVGRFIYVAPNDTISYTIGVSPGKYTYKGSSMGYINKHASEGDYSLLEIDENKMYIKDTHHHAGIIGFEDFSANYVPNSYIQKTYADNTYLTLTTPNQTITQIPTFQNGLTSNGDLSVNSDVFVTGSVNVGNTTYSTNGITNSTYNDSIQFGNEAVTYITNNHTFKSQSGSEYLHLGDGSSSAASYATHLQVNTAPVFPNDVVRLADITGLSVPTNGLQVISPDSIGLGGSLTDNTVINSHSGYELFLGDNDNLFSAIDFKPASHETDLTNNDLSGNSSVLNLTSNDGFNYGWSLASANSSVFIGPSGWGTNYSETSGNSGISGNGTGFTLVYNNSSIGRAYSISANNSIPGISVETDDNAGISIVNHQNFLGGNQLMDYIDVDSIAKAKADSIGGGSSTLIANALTAKADKLNTNTNTNLYTANFATISTDFTNPGAWTTTAGGVTPTAYGLTNYLQLNKQYNLNKKNIIVKFTTGSNTKFALLTNALENNSALGTVVTCDAANSLITIYQAYDSSVGTLPTAEVSKTYTFVSGRDYYFQMSRSNHTNYIVITDALTSIADTLSETTDLTGRQYDAYAMAAISGAFPVVKSLVVSTPYKVGINLLVIGDSITDGIYTGIDTAQRYSELLTNAISNSAISGRGSGAVGGVQARVNSEIKLLHPKYVSILIGTNAGNTVTNLTALCDSIISLGSIPILNNIPWRSDESISARNADIQTVRTALGINGAQLDIATSKNFANTVIDSSLFVLPTPYIHPNPQGSINIFNRFKIDCPELFIKESYNTVQANAINVGPTGAFPNNNSYVTSLAQTYERYTNNANSPSQITVKHRGTPAFPLPVATGDNLGGMVARGGYNQTSAVGNGGADILAQATQNYTATAQGTDIKMFVTANGTTARTEALRIFANGSVAVSGLGALPTDSTSAFSVRLGANTNRELDTRLISSSGYIASNASPYIGVSDGGGSNEFGTAGSLFIVPRGNSSATSINFADYDGTSILTRFNITGGVFTWSHYNTLNGVFYASSTAGVLSQTAQGASNTLLHGNGSGSGPSFSKVLSADLDPTVLTDIAQQSYTGTVTFTATTAPTGTVTNSYSWTQVGHMVTLRMNFKYGTAGALVTGLTAPLPTDMPNPLIPSGFNGASDELYIGVGKIATNLTGTVPAVSNSFIRQNSGATGFEVGVFTATGIAMNFGYATITYFTQ